MKKFLILLTLWCTTITANASLIDIDMTIDIEDKVYGIDDTLTANIYISNLNNGFQQLISEFSFNLMSKDNMLTFQQATFGSKLDVDMFFFTPSDKVVDNSEFNNLFVSEFSYAGQDDLLAAQDGLSRFLLASIDFKVSGLGLAELTWGNVKLFDELGSEYNNVAAKVNSARLGNQVAVPEPSTVAILVLALLMLISMKRKAKH